MSTVVVAAILILAGVMTGIVTIPAALADHPTTMISNLANTTMPGCEETYQCFEPPTITIDTGGEVVWSNDDTEVHTITSGVLKDGGPDGVFDSGLLGPGSTFTYRFIEAGEYAYFCMLHPWMAGMVVVQDPPAVQVAENTITGSFTPSTVTIDIGGEVVWINDDMLLHTVTSGSPEGGGPDGVFDSGPIGPGSTFTFRFTEAGEYTYYCILHPWLTATVEVQESAGGLGLELPEARLTLDPPAVQVSEGDSILISGRLAAADDQGSAIAGQTVLVRDGSADATLVALVTDDDGRFEWVLTGSSQSTYEVYAAYEGGSHGQTESARYSIQVDSRDVPSEPSSSSVTLDQIPGTIRAGEPVTFAGSLTSGGSAIPNRVVWIHEGDDPPRTIGYGVTDAQGGFTVQWAGTGLMEADLVVVYAAFRGDSWYAESQSPNQTALFTYGMP